MNLRLSLKSASLTLLPVAAAILPALRRLSDPDLPWHLAVGRAAVALRGPLPADTFSYTNSGRFVPYEYLSDVLLYAAQRLAGPWGLHILSAAAIAALAWLLVLRPGKPARPVALACSGLALGALAPLLILRPALLGLPFFAAALLCIDRFRADGDDRWLWLLVPLQFIWVNTHAFALVGALVAAGYAAHAALCRVAQGRWGQLLPSSEGRAAKTAAYAALAAVAATCLSSFGPGIFLAPLRVREHFRYLAEWAPASWSLFLGYDPVLGLLVAVTAAALIWGREEDGRGLPPLFDLALLAATALSMLARFRLAPLFIIAAAPWAARRLWPVARGRGWLPAAVLAAALIALTGIAARREVPWGIGFDRGRLPEGAVRFIADAKPQGPVFNNIAFGGYLSWRLYPQVRVFIDGRTAYLYAPEFLAQAWSAEADPAAFAALAARYGWQWAVEDARPGSRSGLPLAMSGDWAMVYVDDTAAVYVNIKGPNRGLMWSGYQLLRHLSPWLPMLQADLPMDALEHDAALALAQAPDSRRAQLWAAAVALRKGDWLRARELRGRLARLAPRDPDLDLLDQALAARAPAR